MKKIILIIATIIIIVIGLIFLFIYLNKIHKNNNRLSCPEAIKKVSELSEISEFIVNNPQAKIECDREESEGWVIHVYEIIPGGGELPSHSATFDWYIVGPKGQAQKYNLIN